MTQEVKVIIGIMLATLGIIGGAIIFMGGPSGKTLGAAVIPQNVLVRSDSTYTGNPKATVTLVEFGDYQCPACALAAPAVQQVIKNYGKTVKIVFRNFPLPQHRNALLAAEAAEAAGAQGKYWEMNEKLYTNQANWSESTNPLEQFVLYAKELNLNEKTFRTAVEDRTFANKINKDKADGLTAEVNGTPTFFINGEKVTVSPTYDNFKEMLDAAAKKK